MSTFATPGEVIFFQIKIRKHGRKNDFSLCIVLYQRKAEKKERKQRGKKKSKLCIGFQLR